MIKEEIETIHIEQIGEPKYWSITMFTSPLPGNSGKVPCYADLVEAAEDILRSAKGLGKEWCAHDANVMAWSDNNDRGVLTPNRFRVRLEMVIENGDREVSK